MPETIIDRSGTDLLTAQTVVEPSPRWVRVESNDEIIADSKRVLLMRESSRRLGYWFPEDDVRLEYLKPSRLGSDGRQYYDVRVRDVIAESAAWSYRIPPPGKEDITGYFTFRWKQMDHWYEEEEEVFVHPRDPYHRVDTLPSSRHIQVKVAGVVIAESNRPFLLFETGLPTRYYIPREDVHMEYLERTSAETVCPYKGIASYWSVNAGGQNLRNLAWGYMDPIAESPKIRGLVCFFNERVDIYVDGDLQERPITPWSSKKFGNDDH